MNNDKMQQLLNDIQDVISDAIGPDTPVKLNLLEDTKTKQIIVSLGVEIDDVDTNVAVHISLIPKGFDAAFLDSESDDIVELQEESKMFTAFDKALSCVY